MNSLFLRCLGILMLLMWVATPALAQVSLKTKQYLLLSGPENTASHQFAEDLAEIWSMQVSALAVIFSPFPLWMGPLD